MFNYAKCNIVLCSFELRPILFIYSVGNTFMSLEVLFDNKVTFNYHCDSISSESYTMFGSV